MSHADRPLSRRSLIKGAGLGLGVLASGPPPVAAIRRRRDRSGAPSTGRSETNARLYKYERRAALATDGIAALRAEYEQAGGQRSNLRYGYVVRSRG